VYIECRVCYVDGRAVCLCVCVSVCVCSERVPRLQ